MSDKIPSHIREHLLSIIAYPATETDGEIILEIGPGRGDFLFHLAETNPDKRIYGIELKWSRFEKLVRRRDKRNLGNLRLIHANAEVAVPKIFEENSVESIHINFPDPWPKNKHAGNRLLKKSFIENCRTILKPGGTLFITTDSESYAASTFKTCSQNEGLLPEYEGIRTESPEAYPTYFAEKWKKAGRTIYYQKHVKRIKGLKG